MSETAQEAQFGGSKKLPMSESCQHRNNLRANEGLG